MSDHAVKCTSTSGFLMGFGADKNPAAGALADKC